MGWCLVAVRLCRQNLIGRTHGTGTVHFTLRNTKEILFFFSTFSPSIKSWFLKAFHVAIGGVSHRKWQQRDAGVA